MPRGLPTPSEMAWALILAVAKRTGIEDRGIRAGGWQTGFPIPLAGKTLGLLGGGHLGGAMVPVAKALGMDVVAWSQNLTEARCAELDVTRVTRDELLCRPRTSSESSSSFRSARATRCVPTISPG
jgi:phosphoglycerate dehydrogenase-like enzyme